MIRLSPAVLAAALLSSAVAFAQGDEPIPYPDDEPEQQKPRRSLPTSGRPEETQVEQQDREQILAGLDDPNFGLGGTFLGGLMLVDSSRGQFAEGRFNWGVRATWEYGRTFFGGEGLREALFADVTWMYTGLRDGTQQVYGDSNYHYFTLAPGYLFPFGQGSPFGVYLQAGAGLAYQFTSIHNGTSEVQVSGIKPLFQYGVGFSGSPRPGADGPFRIAFRVELTRFRRGYMDDTFLGGSLGIAF